ncbi:MAG: hypothetical protein ACI9GW_000104 [Halieaceae bacterium]
MLDKSKSGTLTFGVAKTELELAPLLVLACGALSHEIEALKRLNGWGHMQVKCLDADLHNRPKLIAGLLREKIEQYRDQYQTIFVAYADCGSGGDIDRVLEGENIQRLPGAHCYSFFAGEKTFGEFSEAEPGTLYLTDFLARHFDRLIITGLGLDRHPELMDDYFGNYRRVVYLSQRRDPALLARAKRAAEILGLNFEQHHSGYGDLETGLQAQVLAVA